MDKEDLIYKFGEVMDDVLRESDVALLIDIPKGTLTPTLKDNINLGPVFQFYMLLNALGVVLNDMLVQAEVDPEKKEALIDDLLELVKNGLMDVEEEKKE